MSEEEKARKEAILAQYGHISSGEEYPLKYCILLIIFWYMYIHTVDKSTTKVHILSTGTYNMYTF